MFPGDTCWWMGPQHNLPLVVAFLSELSETFPSRPALSPSSAEVTASHPLPKSFQSPTKLALSSLPQIRHFHFVPCPTISLFLGGFQRSNTIPLFFILVGARVSPSLCSRRHSAVLMGNRIVFLSLTNVD